MRFDPKLSHPDPFLSANLYYAGRIDQVGHQVLAPFARRLRSEKSSNELSFWAMRYGRRGEHWKVRVHGEAEWAESVWDWLRQAWEEGIEAIDPPDPAPEPKTGWLAGPPIDLEDRPKSLQPDRQLIRTEYQRHPVALGAEPLPQHDAHVALMVRCLAASTHVALEGLVPDDEGRFQHQARHSLLLDLVVAALGASSFRGNSLAEYLAYHRDTVLRYLVAYSEVDAHEKSRAVLGRFQRQVAAASPVVEKTRQALLARLEKSTPETPWERSIADLFAYLGPLGEEPELRHLDPFIESSLATALYKICHMASNQIGFTKLNEAFLFHLLLAAVESPLAERPDLALYPEHVPSSTEAVMDAAKVSAEG